MPHKILVVDDELTVLDVIHAFFSKMGFEIIKAHGGKEAIDILRSDSKPDLIIVDMRMPEVSGIDVLTELAKIKNSIKAIILTGVLEEDRYPVGLSELGYGKEDIMYKPADLFALLELAKKKLS
jgi:DNA-binding response OmpR family regulator